MMAEEETYDSPYSTLDCAFMLVEMWYGTRSRRMVTVNGEKNGGEIGLDEVVQHEENGGEGRLDRAFIYE